MPMDSIQRLENCPEFGLADAMFSIVWKPLHVI